MPSVLRHGLPGLLESLSEQQSLRATGALSIGEEARIFIVFGHPLHADIATTTGVEAVAAIGVYALENPECSITWTPGVTAGKTHSLAPGAGVLERLRGMTPGTAASARAEEERATDRIADLGLRRLMAEQSVSEGRPTRDPDTTWGPVMTAICELLEGTLHRHSRGLVDTVLQAEPEPRSILAAVDRARALPIRAVSRAQVASLLDAAELMVRERVALN